MGLGWDWDGTGWDWDGTANGFKGFLAKLKLFDNLQLPSDD